MSKQSLTETAADGRPCLARTVVGDQAVRFRCGVQLLLDVDLVEYSGCDPAGEGPGRAVQCRVPPTLAFALKLLTTRSR